MIVNVFPNAEHLQRILCTAGAAVQGGRDGHGRSWDTRLDVDLAAQFDGRVALDLHAPRLAAEQAADLVTRSHDLCPYSNITGGNIDGHVDRRRDTARSPAR